MFGSADWLRFGLDVLQVVGMVILSIYGWVLNRTKVNKAAIAAVDDDVRGLTVDLRRLETEVRHLPDHEDLATLHEKVNHVANSVEGVRGELTGISRTLQNIHAALLEDRNRTPK